MNIHNSLTKIFIASLMSNAIYAGCEVAGQHFWDPVTPSNNYVQCGNNSYFDGQTCACNDPENFTLNMTCRDNENGIKHVRYNCIPKKTMCVFDPEFNGFTKVSATKNSATYVRCGRGTHWNSNTQQCECDDPANYTCTKICEVSSNGRAGTDDHATTFTQIIYEALPKD